MQSGWPKQGKWVFDFWNKDGKGYVALSESTEPDHEEVGSSPKFQISVND